jgi:DNA-binding CsgD family transcriptional regulator/GAF domain-containing protein
MTTSAVTPSRGDPRRAQRRSLLRLRQMSCLPLPAETLLPEALSCLHELVPSHANVFFWQDARGEVVRIFDERPISPELGRMYAENFYKSRELEVFVGWAAARNSRQAVDFDRLLTVSRSQYEQSAFHQEWMRRIDFHHGLHLPVWQGERCLGILQLHRAPRDPRFNERELDLLKLATPYLAHCLARQEPGPVEWLSPEDDSRRGDLVTDLQGRLLYASVGARRLLSLATAPTLRATLATSRDLLGELARRLRLCRQGEPSPPPGLSVDSAYGRFELRAEQLEAEQAEPGVLSIRIDWLEPLPLRLSRRIQALELPSRQAEVGLALALGESLPDMARRMNLSENTVNSHAKAVYQRLEVNSRTGLLRRLAFA